MKARVEAQVTVKQAAVLLALLAPPVGEVHATGPCTDEHYRWTVKTTLALEGDAPAKTTPSAMLKWAPRKLYRPPIGTRVCTPRASRELKVYAVTGMGTLVAHRERSEGRLGLAHRVNAVGKDGLLRMRCGRNPRPQVRSVFRCVQTLHPPGRNRDRGGSIEKCQTDGSAPSARDAANSSNPYFSAVRCRTGPPCPPPTSWTDKVAAKSLARQRYRMGLQTSSGLAIRCAERTFGYSLYAQPTLSPALASRATLSVSTRAMVFSVRAGRIHAMQ